MCAETGIEIKEKEASNVAEERYEGIGPRCGIAVNQQQRANAEILSGGLSKIKFLFVLKALLGLAEVLNLFLMSPLRLLRASGLGACLNVCMCDVLVSLSGREGRCESSGFISW